MLSVMTLLLSLLALLLLLTLLLLMMTLLLLWTLLLSLSVYSIRSLAQACTSGDIETVRLLLKHGSSVHETTEDGESLLSLAASAGYYELCQVNEENIISATCGSLPVSVRCSNNKFNASFNVSNDVIRGSCVTF